MEIIKNFNLNTSQFSENNLNIVHLYNLLHPNLEIKKKYQEKESEWNLKMKDKSDVSNNFIYDLTNNFRENLKEPIDWDCLDFCNDNIKREREWLKKNNRGYPDNIENTKQLLKRCKDEAERKGFNSWAHYQAYSLGGLDFVKNKLKEYREKIEPNYISLIEKFKELNEGVVNPWDISYLLGKYKKNKNNEKDISWKELSINEGLSKIFEIWKNINITTELSDIELVGVNLCIIKVFLNNKKIGNIILDCYPHEGKYHRGLSTVVLPRSNLQKDSVSYSTVVINDLNKLMKREFVTLVTELAHSLHFVLSKVPITTHLGLEVPVNHMLYHLGLEDNEVSVIQQMEDIKVSEYCIKLFETGEIIESEEKFECNLVQLYTMNSTYYNYLFGDMISSDFYDPKKLLIGMENNNFISF